MSQSGLGKPDPDLEGVELLFHQKGGSASLAPRSPFTGSTCRAKCSNILHDTSSATFAS